MSRRDGFASINGLAATFLIALLAAPTLAAIPVNNPATFVKPVVAPSNLTPASSGRGATLNKKPTAQTAVSMRGPLRGFSRLPVALATPAAVRLAALRAANGNDLRFVADDAGETVRFLAGPNLEPGGSSRLSAPRLEAEFESRALSFLADNATLVAIDNPADELTMNRVESDRDGFHAVRFRQTWRRNEIWGNDLIVRFDPAGRVIGMSGHYRATPKGLIPNAQLDESAATGSARAHVLGQHGRTPTSSSATPVWFDAPGGLRPAFAVIVEAGLDCRRELLVDALTGRIQKDLSLVQTDGAVLGSGPDLTNTNRTLGLYQIGSSFLMTDTRKDMFSQPLSQFPNKPSGTITLINATNGMGDNLTHVTSSNTASWNSFRNAVSGAHFAGQVYDYYRTRHDRQSIDGKKGTMWLVVNFQNNFNNAFWNGQFMVFGNGDGNDFSDLAGSLDVTAHEMSHGVIENTAGLVYEFQSGALNEHFADAFGAATEFFARPGSANWLLGEDVTTPGIAGDALRNMENPGAANVAFGGQQPTHMSEFRNLTSSQDNGGVHINSGIPNRAFFLTATTLDVGRGERIWYRALSQYLMRNSQFVDFRRGCIQAATDLFGGGSTEVTAVTNAMNTVGIVDGSATPAPPPSPDNVGNDLLAVVDPVSDHILSVDPDFSSPSVDISGIAIGAGGRPTFSDNGSLMAFVGANGNIYARTMNGAVQALTDEGGWWSVALSPDGTDLAATTVAEDGRIYVFDLTSSASGFYELTRQNSTPGAVADQVVFADVLEWTLDGQFLVYDALNRSSLGGQSFEYWDINLLRLSDGECFRVFQTLPQGESVGNPTLAQNSDGKIAFDYVSNDGNTYVIGYEFQTGASGTITNNLQSLGRPTFSGDDRQVFYQYINSQAFIYLVTLEADGVTGSGNDVIWATDGYAPVWYTVGTRPTPVTLLAFDLAWTNGDIRVNWQVGDPDQAIGFRLSSATSEEGAFDPSGGLIPMSEGIDGRFEHRLPAPVGTDRIWVRLEEVGRDGSVAEVIRREIRRPPVDARRLQLLPARPNPVVSETQIAFVVPESGTGWPVSLTIFDAAGRRVASLLDNANLPPGENIAAWTATDDRGQPVPVGVYYARLEVAGERVSRNIVVAR
ncbi:MAG: M4 family metallopeptidase [Candidatus Eisenbacteria bacterium]|nr:M4 family metallopeptidase [Candidatus Eisenbacteria bacterium]